MRPTKFPEIPVSLERNTEVFRHPGYNAWGHRRVRHNLVTKQLKQHFTVDIVILILLMKNLRFREDEKLGQIYTVSKWQRWNLAGLSGSKA